MKSGFEFLILEVITQVSVTTSVFLERFHFLNTFVCLPLAASVYPPLFHFKTDLVFVFVSSSIYCSHYSVRGITSSVLFSINAHM